VAHVLCDFPLQGDFLARAKNHRQPIPGIAWPFALLSHALVHAAAVLVITGRPELAALELTLHTWIDWAKSEGLTTFAQDQLLHVACKVVWLVPVFLASPA
jgi:hypothetical protein